MRDSCVYPDHGVCIVSVDAVIARHAEPKILRFCIDHNITITPKSRDVIKIIKHFVICSLIDQFELYAEHRVVLNYAHITQSILGKDMLVKLNHIIAQILKRFKLCNISIDEPIDSFSTDRLYQVRAAVEHCSIQARHIKYIKKYMQQHELTELSRRVCAVATSYALIK